MEDNGDHGADSQSEALGDGRPKSKTISKVVDGVTQDDYPGKGLDLNGTTLLPVIRFLHDIVYCQNNI